MQNIGDTIGDAYRCGEPADIACNIGTLRVTLCNQHLAPALQLCGIRTHRVTRS